MSAERFGAVYFDESTKTTWLGLMNGEQLYDKTAVINVCNQANAPAHVYIAYMVDPIAVIPPNTDYLWFNKELAPYETVQYPALAVGEDARISVYSDIAGVSFLAYGYKDEK